ncbi:MAG: alpha/beta hydrolase [Weeksellaceae bacterium]
MKNLLIGIFTMSLISCSSIYTPLVHSMDEIEYILPTQKIELSKQTTLAYIEEGTGDQTLIFIHGLGSYLPAWNKNFMELAKHYHCIAVDLPGYGKSSKGNYEYSMTYYAGVIKEFIDKKQLKNVVLVGHSMGGQIAMTAALQYPDAVQKLVLIAPAGFEQFNKGQKEWFRNAMYPDMVKYTTAEQIRANLTVNFYNMPEDAEYMITDRIAMRGAADFDAYCYAVAESVKGMVNQPIYDFLPQIKQPTLTFFGAQDNLIPNRFLNGGKTEKYAKDGAEKMPNNELVMLEKTGHFAQFEKANEVNEKIKQFLN